MKKKIIASIFLIAVVFYAPAQMSSLQLEVEPSNIGSAIMAMTESSFDFGEIEQGIPVEHEFTFQNTGDAPLVILNVKTSCGCTASAYSESAIEPGDFGYVRATYNAKNKGVFNKTLTVVSNTGDTKLSIKGVVAE